MTADLDQRIHLLLFIGRKQTGNSGTATGSFGATIVLSTEQDRAIYAALEQKGLVHPAGFSIDREGEQEQEKLRCLLTRKGLDLYQRMEDSYQQLGEQFRSELE